MSAASVEAFRAAIAATLGAAPDDVALFAKGRVALYAILRGLGIRPGDEVIVPAFTCVAVPNAILYTGARPVYVDIDPRTYTIDPVLARAALTDRTRVILAQNTFGLSADLDALADIAADRDVTVVDDCTHGLGGRYHGRPNGSIAGASFFSTQWSKPLSTGLGGFAVSRDAELGRAVRGLEEAAARPSVARSALLRGLVLGAERAGTGRVFRAGRSAYRGLSRAGLVPASSDRTELAGIRQPDGFLATLAPWQARHGLMRLEHLDEQVAARRRIAARYSAWLGERGLAHPSEPPGVEHAFLRYPLEVSDRGRFRELAEQAGVDLGDWFVSPLHPIVDRLDDWGYARGTAPIAEAICERIVNLPTDPRMSPRAVDDVLLLLERTTDLLR